MITEVYPNIYTFSIELPNSPLRQINAYIIKGDTKNVLIDTAFNNEQCLEPLLAGLEKLAIDPTDLEVVITHLHVDHAGLSRYFYDLGCKVYAGDYDGNIINTNATTDDYMDFQFYGKLFGMEPGELDWYQTPNCKYRPSQATPFTPLNPGDRFQVAPYRFEVVDLIGHTPGHIGLYEKDKGFMFSGDTVLDPITPNICYWTDQHPNILGSYMRTLRWMKTLNVTHLFAAHRRVITNPNERIDQIIQHHYDRLQEILDTMEIGHSYTVKEVSSKISWRISIKSWEEFPPAQKWFAGGETMAHLEHLATLGYVRMINQAGVLSFTKLRTIYKEMQS